jgi:integrase
MAEEREGPKWTEAGIRDFKGGGGREVHSDPTMPGLVLLITPADVKTFYLVYRAGGGRAGKKRWLKIGRFPADGGLGWARGRATQIRGEIQAGADPQAERKKARTLGTKKPTVSELCDRFLKVYVDGGEVAAATGRGYRQNIEHDIRPGLGKLRVDEVRATHITALLEPITPGQRGHVRATLNRLFTRAILWEMRDTNPVKGQDKPKNPDAREGYRLTKDELRIVGNAIKAHREALPQLCGLVGILALTGMRPGEVIGSKQGGKPQRPWDDIDLKRGAIRLPAKAHKTGKRAGARTVYLCPEAVAWIKGIQKDGDLIFGGWQNGAKSWAEFRVPLGLEHVQLYDLRHTYISIADELVTPKTRSILVGHSSKSMSDHYTHKLDPELVKGAAKIGKVIAGMLGL